MRTFPSLPEHFSEQKCWFCLQIKNYPKYSIYYAQHVLRFSCYLTSFITSNGSFLTKHTLSTIFYPSSHTTLLESTFNELFALTASSVGLPQPGLHWPLGFRGEHEPWGCVAWWLLFYLGTRNTQSWVDGGDLESKWGSKMNTDVDIDATTSRLKFDPFADDING